MVHQIDGPVDFENGQFLVVPVPGGIWFSRATSIKSAIIRSLPVDERSFCQSERSNSSARIGTPRLQACTP
jgi:hypothetical protein